MSLIVMGSKKGGLFLPVAPRRSSDTIHYVHRICTVRRLKMAYRINHLVINKVIQFVFPLQVWKMASIGWSLSAILSTPQFYVFHTHYVTDPGPFQNMTVCESIWRLRPSIERKVFSMNGINKLNYLCSKPYIFASYV